MKHKENKSREGADRSENTVWFKVYPFIDNYKGEISTSAYSGEYHGLTILFFDHRRPLV